MMTSAEFLKRNEEILARLFSNEDDYCTCYCTIAEGNKVLNDLIQSIGDDSYKVTMIQSMHGYPVTEVVRQCLMSIEVWDFSFAGNEMFIEYITYNK